MNNISQYLQMMDLAGQNTDMQNISGQQGLQQQNMSAMGNLANQALGQQNQNPMQSMADALRAQQKPGLAVGQMRDAQGNIVPDPTYGTGGSVMANPAFNPYENPV